MPFDLYILDMDGTLFRGSEPLPNARETVAELRRRGAMVRFLTNNSSLTRADYGAKLRGMDFEAEDSEILTSAISTACYCRREGLKRLFIVGEAGLKETMREHGLTLEDSGRLDAVVAGICLSFTYETCARAMDLIRRGARFIATNDDATYPLEAGRLAPGAGAMVAAIQACSGEPPFVVGKPNPLMIEQAMREAGEGSERTLVVGDRLETDIEAGIRAGCATHLVLTGVTEKPPYGVVSSADLRGILER